MNISPYEIALIGGAFTIFGALIGGLCVFYFGIEARRNAKRDAGRRLREAFSEELAEMDPVTGNKGVEVEMLLSSAFPKHYSAVIEFSYYLKGTEKAAFEKAWREYFEVGGSMRFFDYYMGDNPKQLFKERVNAILKFTET